MPAKMPRPATSFTSACSRRLFLAAIGSALAARCTLGQSESDSPLKPVAISHTTIRVRDPARSLAWYQEIFGLELAAMHGKTAILRIGEGPQFLAIDGKPSDQPGISHIGFAIDRFDPNRVAKKLSDLGVDSTIRPSVATPRRHDDDRRHDVKPTVWFRDPDGITIQLIGKEAAAASESSTKNHEEASNGSGVLSIRDFNHFTTFVSNRDRTVDFYRRLFQMPIDTYQGAMPLLRIGSDNQFLAFVGAGGRPNFRPFIHHVCFTVNKFEPEKTVQSLADFGVARRALTDAKVKPLQSYVTMRMPDRGGAPDGTPELYFTDPDGILLQIQDERYSGGSGYLGNVRGKIDKNKSPEK